jgi:hypothetical protein
MDYVDIAAHTISERYKAVIYGRPQLSDMPSGTIVGTFAYSVPHVARFILDRQKEMRPNTGVMPADVTRAWLNDAYKLPLRFRLAQVNQPTNRAPQFVRKGIYDDCVYVDISKTFRNVISLGFDLEYQREKYLAVRPVQLPEVIAQTKLCYSLTVSISKNQESRVPILGKQGNIFTPAHFNIYSNPQLWLLAVDVEGAFARVALETFGKAIHYINADGYIIDRKYAGDLEDIIASFGFTSKRKGEGETEVLGAGSYTIGAYKTKALRTGRDISVIDMPLSTSVWLLKRMRKLSQLFYR